MGPFTFIIVENTKDVNEIYKTIDFYCLNKNKTNIETGMYYEADSLKAFSFINSSQFQFGTNSIIVDYGANTKKDTIEFTINAKCGDCFCKEYEFNNTKFNGKVYITDEIPIFIR